VGSMKTPSNDDVIMREYRSPMTSSDAETDSKLIIIIIKQKTIFQEN